VKQSGRILLSGNEAIALAARAAGVALGAGYPGTPSTEILEHFSRLGGKAQWSPNEKVALEVGLGVGMGGAAALVTMKHVGLNVAADPLFTAAYTGTSGPVVVVSADDPGMASSQNEQDNRRYAVAAGVPMLEPADSQEAYQYTLAAIEISRRWQIPVLLRLTTRVCHSKSVVQPEPPAEPPRGKGDSPHLPERPEGCFAQMGTVPFSTPGFVRDIPGRVMIPAYARPAHRRLRKKLDEIAQWNETSPLNQVLPGAEKGTVPICRNGPEGASHKWGLSPFPHRRQGIVTSGVAYMHAREAAPDAAILKLGMTYPLPLEKVRQFAASVESCQVIEEGDPYLVEQLRSAGIAVEGKPPMYRFGELNVARVRRILAGDASPEPDPPRGKPPALCPSCPHRPVFSVLHKLDCIVAGDIGCYSLGVLPPFEAMDSLVCMGAGVTMGLGLRHVLPDEQARRVVSVIGDSTFMHSGITGLVEMVYNPPPSGHVVIILDNSTTAMTGLQEHPGTGRTLDHRPTGQIVVEDLVRALGIRNVHVLDPTTESERLEELIRASRAANELTVLITRRTCLLAAGRIRQYDSQNEERA